LRYNKAVWKGSEVRMGKLILKQKVIKDGVDYFVFINSASGNKQLVLNYADSLKLISKYEPKDRNCKVSMGVIGLKAGQGHLPVLGSAGKQTTNNKSNVVQLITDWKYANSMGISTKVISNDDTFNSVKYDVGFLQRHSDIMQAIDKATIVNEVTLEIRTPYGITSVDSLSTGCKTLLNIAYLQERIKGQKAIVNIDECGNNTLDKIFNAVKGTNIYLFISHDTAAVNTKYKFYINGNKLKDEFEFTDIIWGEQ